MLTKLITQTPAFDIMHLLTSELIWIKNEDSCTMGIYNKDSLKVLLKSIQRSSVETFKTGIILFICDITDDLT